MKLKNVLVVFKHSAGGGVEPDAVSRQAIHDGAIAEVGSQLARRNIAAQFLDRNDLKDDLSGDLLIAVGGDGTALAAAHLAGRIPLLCVNSLPGHSVGFFCAARPDTFGSVIDKIISGKLEPKVLPLVEAKIGSNPLPFLALNEILFAATTPAETASYILKIGEKSERQKSSGVWISAGPGSTSAILSAGGRKMSVGSRRLQFLVREPCRPPGKRLKLLRGILPRMAEVEIIPLVGDAFAYIDGPRLCYPVPMGSELSVKVSAKTVSIFL